MIPLQNKSIDLIKNMLESINILTIPIKTLDPIKISYIQIKHICLIPCKSIGTHEKTIGSIQIKITEYKSYRLQQIIAGFNENRNDFIKVFKIIVKSN